jgi:hypothetical protein
MKGDLRKLHYGSYASDLMSKIYNDMINTIMAFFSHLIVTQSPI